MANLKSGNADIGYVEIEKLRSFALLKDYTLEWMKYLDGDMLDPAPTRQFDTHELGSLPFAGTGERVPDDLKEALDSVQLSQEDVNDLVGTCIMLAYNSLAENLVKMQEEAKVWGIVFPQGEQPSAEERDDDIWEL